MAARKNRHRSAATSFYALFWCALAKIFFALALVVIEHVGAVDSPAVLPPFMLVLAIGVCLLIVDRAYLLRLTRFSARSRWQMYRRSAGLGALGILVAALAMFVTLPVLTVFAVFESPPGLRFCIHCARAAAVLGAIGGLLLYIRTSQLCAMCATVCHNRPVLQDARHVLRCLWGLVCVGGGTGAALLLAPELKHWSITALVTTACLGAHVFGFYCLTRHLMLVARTAGALDLVATESAETAPG